MLTAVHDHSGHRGFFATKALLTQRFWWPEMEKDISWYVKTCHVCQERQIQLAKAPSQVQWLKELSQCLHILQRSDYYETMA